MVWAVSLLTMDLITHCLTAEYIFVTLEFDYVQYPEMGHHIFSALPSHDFTSTLALKLFRGEPAISEFDWNFTPSHNSSANVSTGVGSVLHRVLPQLQPGHG